MVLNNTMFRNNIYDNVRTRVIVTHGQKMLVLEPEPPDEGWRLPGGGMEPNESLAECAVREVMEETGIAIQVSNIAFLREWVVPKYCVIPGETGTTYAMEVYLYATPTTQDLEVRRENPQRPMGYWIPFADVAKLPLWPKELKTLAAWLAAGNVPQGVPSFVSQLESPDAAAPDVRFA